MFDTKCYAALGRTVFINEKSAIWTEGSPSWVQFA